MPPKKKLKYLSEVVHCENQSNANLSVDHQVTHLSHDLTPCKRTSLEDHDQVLVSIARTKEVKSSTYKISDQQEIQRKADDFLRNLENVDHLSHYSMPSRSHSSGLNDQSLYSIAQKVKLKKQKSQVPKENGQKCAPSMSQVGQGSTRLDEHYGIKEVHPPIYRVPNPLDIQNRGHDSSRNKEDHQANNLSHYSSPCRSDLSRFNDQPLYSIARAAKENAKFVKTNPHVLKGNAAAKGKAKFVKKNSRLSKPHGHKNVSSRSQVGKSSTKHVEQHVTSATKEKTNFPSDNLQVPIGNGDIGDASIVKVGQGSTIVVEDHVIGDESRFEFGQSSSSLAECHIKGGKEAHLPTYGVPNPLEIQSQEIDFLKNVEDHQVNSISTPHRTDSSRLNEQSLYSIASAAKEKAKFLLGHKNVSSRSQVGQSSTKHVEHHVTSATKEKTNFPSQNLQVPIGNGDASTFKVGQASTIVVEDHVIGDASRFEVGQSSSRLVQDHVSERERSNVDIERCLSQQHENIEDMSSRIRQSCRMWKRNHRAKRFKDMEADLSEYNGSYIIEERKGRGWIGYKSIKPPIGKSHHDCWTLKNEPIGNECGILVNFLGLKARDTDSFPLHLRWGNLQRNSFYGVWAEVEKLFKFKSYETKLTPNMYFIMKWCLAKVKNSITTFRHNLKDYLYMLPPERLQFSPETRISQEQWYHLLMYWSKEETKLVAEQNTTNRDKIRATVTLGTKSMRRKQFELMVQGHEASDYHTYMIAHKYKNGEFPNEYTKRMMEEVEAEAHHRNVQDSHNALDFGPVLDHVHGDRHGGYQRGYGNGLTRQLLKEAPMMEIAQKTYQDIEKEAAFRARALENAQHRLAHMMGQNGSISSHARGSNSDDDGPISQAEHSNNNEMDSHANHSYN